MVIQWEGAQRSGVWWVAARMRRRHSWHPSGMTAGRAAVLGAPQSLCGPAPPSEAVCGANPPAACCRGAEGVVATQAPHPGPTARFNVAPAEGSRIFMSSRLYLSEWIFYEGGSSPFACP